jgi:hypothetical protein
MRTTKKLAPILCLMLVLVANASNAAADTTVATLSKPAPVSFFEGRLAWSSFDPATNAFVLMTRVGGATMALPVEPRSVPFDVDLGPDRNGATVAVYSRCRRDPGFTTAIGNAIINQLPDWRSGRGCDLYKFDFDTGRETRVRGVNTGRASEFLPSIWRNRIAFARVYERRAGKAGQRAYLYRASTTGRGGSKRFIAGPRANLRLCFARRGKRVCRIPVELGPTALDLHGRQLAFAWTTATGPGGCESSSGIWLDTISEARRRIATGCSGDIQAIQLLSPTISSNRINYGYIGFGDSMFNRIHRYNLATNDVEESALGATKTVLWTSTGAGTTAYLVSGGYEPGCAEGPRVIEPGVGPDTGPCPLVLSPG